MTACLTVDDVLEIHGEVLAATGGAPGLRDTGLLDSAVQRPSATFGGADLYPEIEDKAGALLHSLVANHPFVDGNKRTGFAAMDVFLRLNGRRYQGAEDETYDWVIRIASGQIGLPEIVDWLKQHVVRN